MKTNKKIMAFCIAIVMITILHLTVWISSAMPKKAETTTQLETTISSTSATTTTETTSTTAPETTTKEETTTERQYKTLTVSATAYCPCRRCCGKTDGITACGTKATAGRTIAVDPSVIPYGSKVEINGHTYIAEDCGGAIKGNRIDIFFATHEEALQFGRQQIQIKVFVG